MGSWWMPHAGHTVYIGVPYIYLYIYFLMYRVLAFPLLARNAIQTWEVLYTSLLTQRVCRLDQHIETPMHRSATCGSV